MRRGLRRIEGGMPDSLRFFGRKLAAPEKRSFRAHEALGKVPQGKNAGTDREKCSIASDRTADRFARGLPATAAQVDRSDRQKYRRHFNPGPELRRTRRDYRRDQESASRD